MDPLVAVSDLSVTYAGADRPAVAGATFDVRPGEIVWLRGPSGAGKSTIALALAGLIPHAVDAELEGSMRVAGVDTRETTTAWLSTRVGMVFQDPDAQVVTATAFDEVCFALENLLLPADEVARLAEAALRTVELWDRRDDDPAVLSGGGRQRLAIACAIATEAPLIVLDEPTANLDPAGVADVYAAVRAIADADRSVVLIEHDEEAARSVATRTVEIGSPRQAPAPRPPRRTGARAAVASSGPAVSATHLTISRGERLVLDDVSVEIPHGSFTAIVGPNGAGKTTLAQALAGVIRAPKGSVSVAGMDPARTPAREVARFVGFVFQNPEHQFVTATVRDELAHELRRLRVPRAEVDERVDAMLERFGLEGHADQHPFRLSGGQKRRLSVGTALIGMTPRGVLILDEPLYGQDPERSAEIIALLDELHDDGTTIVVVTHDMRLVASHADQVIEVGAGSAPPAAPPADAPARRRLLELLDPLAKTAAVLPGMVGLVLSRDSAGPAILLALTYAALLIGAPLTRRLALWLGAALPAMGLVLWGGFTLWSGPEAGIATALRLTAMIALALVPGLTSDGADMVRSFVAHLRIPYRIGYAGLAALRFVPRFRYESDIIRAAHRVRGERSRGAAHLIALLAGGIRHAERVALAMDARAFGAHPTRTERSPARWRRRDTAFAAVGALVCVAAIAVPAILG
ncbi:ATP-binding cassette domain-containing protein [Microbacterium indicum]|uniref:ATP-binding cassette domain-containing protein n=1 Tax=Microbacterium indicum TaxID=358100 RepID=UPI00042345A3|nr:ATP-binding cassette domain-containing protein [Microbacterium indicum]